MSVRVSVGLRTPHLSSRRNKPPGPRSSGWFNLIRYLADPIGFFSALARTYGDLVYLPLGRNDVYLVSDPALIRQVLVTDEHAFHKGGAYREMKRLLGEGLLTSEAEFHRRQRKLMQPLFLKERIGAYGDLMGKRAETLSMQWQPNAVVDLNGEMSRLTLAIVGEALFGVDLEQDAPEIGEALAAALVVFNRFLLPFASLLRAMPLPSTRRFERGRAAVDELIEGLVAERRERPDNGDLLSRLLSASDDQGHAISDEQLRDEAVTILFAGHETTAVGLAWAWYLLAQHPQVEEKLHAEVDDVLGGRAARATDLEALRYTRMVFQEALRLYPPAWVIVRRALVDLDLDGHHIGAGANVVISQAVLHRDPRFFPEPDRFLPERWLEEDPARFRYRYMPFGAGPRVCIGSRFASMEGVLILATLAQRWKLRLVAGQRMELHPIVTLRPRRPIRVRLEDRTTGPAQRPRGRVPGAVEMA